MAIELVEGPPVPYILVDADNRLIGFAQRARGLDEGSTHVWFYGMDADAIDWFESWAKEFPNPGRRHIRIRDNVKDRYLEMHRAFPEDTNPHKGFVTDVTVCPFEPDWWPPETE